MGFEVVAEQASQAEVTRLFSAMLQLINNGNIQLLPAQQAQRPFQLRLLDTQLLHRKFLDGPVVPSQPSKVTEFPSLVRLLALQLDIAQQTNKCLTGSVCDISCMVPGSLPSLLGSLSMGRNRCGTAFL